MSPAVYVTSLTVLAILTGLAVLPVFRRFSDNAGISLAKRKVRAALYAFRLFGDEPRLVFRAQGQLLLWNVRYLGLVLRPAALVIVPIVLLSILLDGLYGHQSLRPGESTLVTARMANSLDLMSTSPELRGQNILIETPPVRIPEEHKVLWKVRAIGDGRPTLSWSIPGSPEATDAVQESVRVGPGFRFVSERRVSSFADWLLYPGQQLLPRKGPFCWIEVQYPDAAVHLLGVGIPWFLWFMAVSWATVFVFRKRFGVVI